LLQGFLGEKFGRDSIWEAHLAGELWHTTVPIQAILDTIERPLREVLEWHVGTRIPLNATTDSDVRLVCGDLQMFVGRMGRKAGSIAVRVTEKIEKGPAS
ncbi:MAG TPA: FliM/FliN family flagellar motor switch protein, partial [Stellaceae bacterium]|nr:FliM/FliN family flagellar motor switch protein [Stellaceae bacterium]